MGTRRFDLDIGHVKHRTAKLLSITSSKYEQDWLSASHSHFFTEIFYVKKGRGHMRIENQIITLQPDDIVIINMQVLHTEISSPADPLEYYVIGVEDLSIQSDESPYYSLIHCPDQAFRQIFENIYTEMHNQQEDYVTICQSYLEILVLQLCRKKKISYDIVENTKGTRECYQVKRYIETNYHDKITLETLAKHSNLTKFYLSHKFSELYNESPISYLNHVRINACKNLLRTTNHSISEIAEMTGFSSPSYLSQTFTKHCGMSPQQFRKQETEK